MTIYPVASVPPANLGVALNNELDIDVTQISWIAIEFKAGGSSGGVITLEGRIDITQPTNWSPVQFHYMDAATGPLGVGALPALVAGVTQRVMVSCSSITQLRLRVSTILGAQLASLAYLPVDGDENGAPFDQNSLAAAVPVTASTVNLVNSLATTNATSVKAAPGNVMEVSVSNPTATPAALKFYNKASAPTVGTDIPVVTIPVAASSFAEYLFGPTGKRFTTGIALAVTGLITDVDVTVAPAGLHISTSYI